MITSRKKTLIIIPAYNEAGSITRVLKSVRNYSPYVDILVVNDGSIDDTENIVRGLMEEDAHVYLINLPYNMGIGNAMQTGFIFGREKGYDVCVQCDGDGQHPAHQINRLIEAVVHNDIDIAIGSRFRLRYTYTSTAARRIGIYVLSKIVSFSVKKSITDPTIGFRAFSREAVRFFSVIYPSDYPEPESLILAHRKGLKIEEVPIKIMKRKHGISSINFLDSIYYMVKVTIAIIIDLFEDLPEDA